MRDPGASVTSQGHFHRSCEASDGSAIPNRAADGVRGSGGHRIIQPDPARPLALSVGCTFGLRSTQSLAAVLQVAPRPDPSTSIRAERWITDLPHHGYGDAYGKR